MSLAGKDLNLLVALRALLEEKNVTRAGGRIDVGQSGMSAALSRLRTHYRDDLLVRVGREFELSPTAKLLLPHVRRAVPLIERSLGHEAAFDPATSDRRFSFAASDYAVLELHDRLGPALKDYPGISFDYSPFGDEPLDETHLMRFDFTMALPGSGLDGDFAALFSDHFVCVLDRDNPRIAADGTLSWEDFRASPQIASSFGPRNAAPYDHRLGERDYVREPRISTRGFLQIPAIVENTSLVGILPSRLAQRICEPNGTVWVEPPFGRVDLVEMLYWHPSREADPAHRWARELILAAFAGDRAESFAHD